MRHQKGFISPILMVFVLVFGLALALYAFNFRTKNTPTSASNKCIEGEQAILVCPTQDPLSTWRGCNWVCAPKITPTPTPVKNPTPTSKIVY